MLCFQQYCSKDKTFPIMDGIRPLKKTFIFFRYASILPIRFTWINKVFGKNQKQLC